MKYETLNGFVYFSKAAYESGSQQIDTIKKGLKEYKVKKSNYIVKDKGLYAYGLQGNDSVLISFRGTTPTFSEMWNGFVKTGMNEKGYEVGMYNQYEWLKQASGWPQFLQGKTKVYFTGHSLGAAMSMFATMDFGEGVDVTTINYACPRLGDKRYQQKMDKFDNVYRVVNNQDPVPHSPGTIFGFVHGGKEINVTYMEECTKKGASSLASGNYTTFLMFGMIALLVVLVLWVIIRGSLAATRAARNKMKKKDVGITYGLFTGVVGIATIIVGLYYAYYYHGVDKYVSLIDHHTEYTIMKVACDGKHWGSLLGPWVIFFLIGCIFFIALGYKDKMGASKVFVLFTLASVWTLSLLVSIVQVV